MIREKQIYRRFEMQLQSELSVWKRKSDAKIMAMLTQQSERQGRPTVQGHSSNLTADCLEGKMMEPCFFSHAK